MPTKYLVMSERWHQHAMRGHPRGHMVAYIGTDGKEHVGHLVTFDPCSVKWPDTVVVCEVDQSKPRGGFVRTVSI